MGLQESLLFDFQIIKGVGVVMVSGKAYLLLALVASATAHLCIDTAVDCEKRATASECVKKASGLAQDCCQSCQEAVSQADAKSKVEEELSSDTGSVTGFLFKSAGLLILLAVVGGLVLMAMRLDSIIPKDTSKARIKKK